MTIQTRLGYPKQKIIRKFRRDIFRRLPISARTSRRYKARWGRWKIILRPHYLRKIKRLNEGLLELDCNWELITDIVKEKKYTTT